MSRLRHWRRFALARTRKPAPDAAERDAAIDRAKFSARFR
jgi:hypothetical protein